MCSEGGGQPHTHDSKYIFGRAFRDCIVTSKTWGSLCKTSANRSRLLAMQALQKAASKENYICCKAFILCRQ